jgi:hypothetical protein
VPACLTGPSASCLHLFTATTAMIDDDDDDDDESSPFCLIKKHTMKMYDVVQM